MEALNQRLDLMEERMEELEKENAGLKKEISSLKRQNIDYQDELSAVKKQLNSLDRKFKIKSQEETSPSTSHRSERDDELLDIKDQMKSQKKKITGLEKSGIVSSAVTMLTDNGNDKRLTNLEQQVNGIVALQKLPNKLHLNLQSKIDLEKELSNLKQRFQRLEHVLDLERKNHFYAELRCSQGFKRKLTKLDECDDHYGFFNEETCTFSLQEDCIYSVLFDSYIWGGKIELYLNVYPFDSEPVFISSSDQWNGYRVFPLFLASNEYFFSAKRSSGNPKGTFTVELTATKLEVEENYDLAPSSEIEENYDSSSSFFDEFA